MSRCSAWVELISLVPSDSTKRESTTLYSLIKERNWPNETCSYPEKVVLATYSSLYFHALTECFCKPSSLDMLKSEVILTTTLKLIRYNVIRIKFNQIKITYVKWLTSKHYPTKEYVKHFNKIKLLQKI